VGKEGTGRLAGSSPNREAIVSTGSVAMAASTDPAATPITKLGERGAQRRSTIINTSASAATPTA
jgi:hypothetical protein